MRLLEHFRLWRVVDKSFRRFYDSLEALDERVETAGWIQEDWAHDLLDSFEARNWDLIACYDWECKNEDCFRSYTSWLHHCPDCGSVVELYDRED